MARFGRPMGERNDEPTVPTYTVGILGGVPALVMADDRAYVTASPELFDTAGGAIGFADGYMGLLAGMYADDAAMRASAADAAEQFDLDVEPDASEFPVPLVIGMTAVEG